MAPPMTTLDGKPFSRPPFESLLKRRMFYTESFEIYRTSPKFSGDNRGLYDYGPPGCALLANIVNEWRKHFVIEENMLEIDTTVITPEAVLKTSGHVDKFADWMCRDIGKGEYLRADHLVESVLEERVKTRQIRTGEGKNQKVEKLDDATVREYEEILAKIDNYDGPELGQLIKTYDIRNPNGNSQVEEPQAFNLMFKSTIGPSAASPVYPRPETAQGQFLNFKKLLDYSQGIMPFASACIGKSYRNEISPRSGLLRVREFLLAEIEHFVDPEGDKRHERFHEVAGVRLPFLDKNTQLSGRTTITTKTIGEAVQSDLVDNETLGYFLARVYLFLIKIGADATKIRFRQHLDNEMAHYACDLKNQEITEWEAALDKKLLGPQFKKDAKKIETAVAALSQDSLENLVAELAEKAVVSVATETLADGKDSVELSSEMWSIQKVTRTENTREYVPNVIEPSFGIGRILYSILEHSHWHRAEDTARQVLSLPVLVAPTKVLLAPLSNNAELKTIVKDIARRLRHLGLANNVDTSGVSIGKRYARNDELGTPFAITVDFETLEDGTVTLRERDSTGQVRASRDAIIVAFQNMVSGIETWERVIERLPAFLGPSEKD